ncbi:MAG TPA: hypothetical protein PLV56_10290, partial [Synergistales bacterium]|nr:hypothetical protein [Synergistales bacterium]
MKNRLWLIQFVILLADTFIIWALFLVLGLLGKSSSVIWILAFLYYFTIILCLYAFRGYDLTGTRSREKIVMSTFQGLEMAALLTALIIFFTHKSIPIFKALGLFTLFVILFS